MSACLLCPRRCGTDRAAGERGFCGMGSEPVVARSAAHFGEEPCISGVRGSGTVFFSGCSLHCVFCQNREISIVARGREVTVPRLVEIFGELEAQGVHNLNLVTATHFADSVVEALKIARPSIPVVWNSSGYEAPETLKMLEGFVSVYLPDLKYSLPSRASRYSGAGDYPETAKAAVSEMFRQTGPYVLDGEGIMRRGVLIRHLMLPGALEDTLDIIDFVSSAFPKNGVLFSLMSQYTPLADKKEYPELARRIDSGEYERARRYLDIAGITDGYTQEPDSATEEMIPNFDLSGV